MSRGEVLGSLHKFLIEPRPSPPSPSIEGDPRRLATYPIPLHPPNNLNAFDNLISGTLQRPESRYRNKPWFQPGSLLWYFIRCDANILSGRFCSIRISFLKSERLNASRTGHEISCFNVSSTRGIKNTRNNNRGRQEEILKKCEICLSNGKRNQILYFEALFEALIK